MPQENKMNWYEATAKYYDYLNPINPERIGFYKNFLKKNYDVLELGCGTGQISLELARFSRKTRFDCVDISDQMLDEFRKKIAYLSGAVTYTKSINIIKSPMEEFQSDKKYDLILYPGQSIQCLPRSSIKDQLRRTLEYSHDGTVIIITLFDSKKRLSTTPETLNGIAFYNSAVSYIESLYKHVPVKDRMVIGFNEFLSDNGEVTKYRLKLRDINWMNGFVEETAADDFTIGSVDYGFACTLHHDLPLGQTGFYSSMRKDACGRNSMDFICVYTVKNNVPKGIGFR
ncbi:class I SAM-dependent methyltransferase [Breznakiella homolactica]|uniref:Class I SAM-dependent methyltransferase n=1 Tax=Breznakiella homolactica TaxID=2798577 RepID=A0A7T7XPC6_9SPIR|nr:class I SAM-dependent methyltransferase [Breznakiella homolactica]QQO10035.1 class I SAM-dependent methyltransferase [Breznakiella homolactica]